MLKKTRIIIGCILFVILLIGILYVYINKDSLFDQKVIVRYNNGCTETYIKGELITTPCSIGQSVLNKTNFNYGNFTIK